MTTLFLQALVKLHTDLLRGDDTELQQMRVYQRGALAASRPERVRLILKDRIMVSSQRR